MKDSISHSTTTATLGVLLWLLLTLLPVVEADGQGTVQFNNCIPGGPGVGITLHVWGPASPVPMSLIGLGSNDIPSGTTPFGSATGMALIGAGGSGGHYGYATTFAQLLGAVGSARPVSALVPVGQTTTFRSGSSLGCLAPITVTLTNNPGGGILIPADAPYATFQIAAWDNSSGSFPTWAQARVAWMGSQIRAGISAPFTVRQIGGVWNLPPNLNNDEGSANGMMSFNLYGDCIYCSQPIVTTLPASAVTENSATLNAAVNPNGEPTSAWFQWTTNLGSYGDITRPPYYMGSGTGTLSFSAPVAGLNPNTTYYFRVIASSGGSTIFGSYLAFSTPSPPRLIISMGGYWCAGSSNLTYTGGGPRDFILLQSADPTAPLSVWTRVATNVGTPGTFPIPPVGAAAAMYYRVKSE